MRRLKILEIDITSPSFDFGDAVTRIDQYCYKNHLSPKVSAKLQSVFEELCMQILMPVLDDPAIHVTIEYDQLHEVVEMTIEYPGDFRIDKGGSLAYKVLMAKSESVVRETLPDGSGSTVRVQVK